MNEILGATFWSGTEESLQKAQEFFASCGIPMDGLRKIVCPWGRMTFIFMPAPFEVAYTVWQSKLAYKLPPFYCQLPASLKFFLAEEEILYPLEKWEIKISNGKKELLVSNFFPHWLLIPLPLNHLEAPGAMTLRWQLPVEERFLREIVVLYNGLVYFPPEMSPNFGDLK
ncbi:MAG: hypothetical protein V1860_03610 [bacterium]